MSILRNLNAAFDGSRILGVPEVGVLGTGAIVSGPNGDGLLAAAVVLNGLQSSLVRAQILSHNFPAGKLTVDENGAFEVLAVPDGVYTIFYRLWIDGVASTVDLGYGPGVGVITITIGVAVTLPVPVVLPFEVFLSYVLPFVPGCPDQTVIQHARQASIEFFQRTLAWRRRLDDVTALAGYVEYEIPLPSQSAMAKLVGYYLNNCRCQVVNVAQGDSLRSYRDGAEVAWTVTRTTFSVSPEPKTGDLMSLDTALKPTQTSQGIYDFLWEEYAEHLQNGALARLFSMPNQPWTDLGLTAYYGGLFKDAIDRVGMQTGKAFSSSRQRVRGTFY